MTFFIQFLFRPTHPREAGVSRPIVYPDFPMPEDFAEGWV